MNSEIVVGVISSNPHINGRPVPFGRAPSPALLFYRFATLALRSPCYVPAFCFAASTNTQFRKLCGVVYTWGIMYMYIYIYIERERCIYIYIYMCIYIYIYTYICIYIYIHIHTYYVYPSCCFGGDAEVPTKLVSFRTA